jgi:valyl-tRNA synthetase
MDSTQASAKPISEKQRLKLEKFANKKEKQAQQAQLQQAKEKKSKKPEVPVESKDWVEETPAGQKRS